MSKKVKVIASTIVFLICFPLTLFLINLYDYLTPEPPSPPLGTPMPINLTTQQNILLIYTDKIQGEKPELISAWLLLIKPSSPASIGFKALYPTLQTDSRAESLHKRFTLLSDGRPSRAFFTQFEKYNVKPYRYLMVDAEAGRSLYNWITTSDIGALPPSPNTQDDIRYSLQFQDLAFNNLCKALKAGKSPAETEPVWDYLLSSHLRTDLPIESIKAIWTTIQHSEPPPSCEVLSNIK
jgi:hypothetical protein